MALPATPEPGASCPDLRVLAAEHPWLAALAGTPVDDGETDVLDHTRLVAEQLLRSPQWRRMEPEDRGELWLATLLHDAGKPATTRYERGRWTAPGHARHGAIIARRVLWEAGLSPFARERICGLVRHHMAPYRLIDSEHATRRTIEISLEAGVRRQHLLSRSDALARSDDLTTDVDLFAVHAEELGCLERPYPFASDHARFTYFTHPSRDPAYAAHDDTRSRVVVLSGLPGAGKDQWIARHHQGRPTIAVDDRERARTYLREGKPFIWNATHHSRELRASTISLLADYRAHVTIVAVEARPHELRRHNQERRRPVPWEAVERVLDDWEAPSITECHRLEVWSG
ncbi:AAA family ATPase [Solirubrobacter ginsenosidimutans]|uniref:AAA family ATPase n=1 Tax=Solirubrobacter ginsenosidimutans TaxID=490573 RepID=A0A9X3MPN7_9ACTN|nr:AAA family ATPase [Solirubrobacter ginsenosidimutans]MDA0160107.1 AAA family ATPase [Solirubrobacter ginsenosidimutans]